MAEPTLAEMLMRNPLAGEERPSRTYGAMGEPYDVQYVEPPPIGAMLGARFGFRGMPQGRPPPGPWTPKEAPPRGPAREWKEAGDDSVGQNVYEAILGRLRKPGEAVAQPGSGWWTFGPLAIPKLSNPLPHIAAGAAGYGLYNALGGPENARKMSEQPWMIPGTPEYEERWARYPDDPNYKGDIARKDAQHADRKLAHQYGIPGWTPFADYFSNALTPEQQAKLEKHRLPGGVGNAPY